MRVRYLNGTRQRLWNHQCWVRSIDSNRRLTWKYGFRYFAQRSLRIERMYPSWGHDIDKKTTPFHLNREYHVSFDVSQIG